VRGPSYGEIADGGVCGAQASAPEALGLTLGLPVRAGARRRRRPGSDARPCAHRAANPDRIHPASAIILHRPWGSPLPHGRGSDRAASDRAHLRSILNQGDKAKHAPFAAVLEPLRAVGGRQTVEQGRSHVLPASRRQP
jgi:hypothetical protein